MGSGIVDIDIAGPLTLWLILLIMGVVMALVFVPLTSGTPMISKLISEISGWILYLPGSLILPLIVSLWVGENVGATRSGAGFAARAGLINAVYTTLIYVVAIFIIYLLLYYISPASLSSITLIYFAEYVVVLPALILLVLVPLISSLSAARHSSA